jgi:hypothetical protein
MKLLRMSPGHGDVLLAEGDPEVAEDEELLIEEFRRQLDLGMWAAVPRESEPGRHEASMVREFSEIPPGSDRVIFFPRAAGGSRDRDVHAETRARELLASVAGSEVSAMYEELGFVAFEPGEDPDYGYLLYPHRPIVAYDAASGELLSEYCVRFPDEFAASDDERWLPPADDVLAKWMALRADEHALIGTANMHLLGRQLDPSQVRRDLARLSRWRSQVAA